MKKRYHNVLSMAVTLLSLLDLLLCSAASTGFHGPAVVTSKVSTEEGSFISNSSSSSETEKSVSTSLTKNITDISLLPEWRKRLPAELQNKTKTLQRIVVPGSNGCRVEVYLLGTAHVSNDSSSDVRMLLEAIDPDVLFLELCDQRIPMMLSPPTSPQVENVQGLQTEQPKQGFWKRIRSRARTSRKDKAQPKPDGGRSAYGIAANLLTNMQQDYAHSLGVELGGEFRVAYNYWEEYRQHRNIHMILGDRPLYLTLSRAWQSLGIWGKTKLLVSLLISSLQKPDPEELRAWMQKILSDDTGDLLSESIAELAKHFPALERVIIQERDAYMACKLYQTCRSLLQPLSQPYVRQPSKEVFKLIAIVGAGHVEGMCKLLTVGNGKQPEEMLASLIDLKNPIPVEDRHMLIYDVMEVNAELLHSMAQDMQTSASS